MTRGLAGLAVAVAAAVLLAGPTPAAGQGQVLHGESAAFAGPGIALAWGVLRMPVEDDTQAVLRIAVADGAYAYVGVEAIDPFTQARRPVLPSQPITGTLDVRSPRRLFADFPRREVRLYRTAEERRAGTPALTVYYLGLPDTTPEFTSEARLLEYLAAAVATARAGGAGRTP